jgi:hypothetical protein
MRDKKEINSRSSLYFGTEFTLRTIYFLHVKITTFHMKLSGETQRFINFKESHRQEAFCLRERRKTKKGR